VFSPQMAAVLGLGISSRCPGAYITRYPSFDCRATQCRSVVPRRRRRITLRGVYTRAEY